jgi:hypothetical protein
MMTEDTFGLRVRRRCATCQGCIGRVREIEGEELKCLNCGRPAAGSAEPVRLAGGADKLGRRAG